MRVTVVVSRVQYDARCLDQLSIDSRLGESHVNCIPAFSRLMLAPLMLVLFGLILAAWSAASLSSCMAFRGSSDAAAGKTLASGVCRLPNFALMLVVDCTARIASRRLRSRAAKAANGKATANPIMAS